MSTEVLVTTARRTWPTELKRQILSEAEQPGSSICSVAKAYNVDPAQLYQWRKKFRVGQDATDTDFIPVDITARPEISGGNDPVEAPRRERAELAFPNGVHNLIASTGNRLLWQADDRRVISGIIYVLKSGGRWVDAPRDEYGSHKTLYNRYVRWAEKDVWGDLFHTLSEAGGPSADKV